MFPELVEMNDEQAAAVKDANHLCGADRCDRVATDHINVMDVATGRIGKIAVCSIHGPILRKRLSKHDPEPVN